MTFRIGGRKRSGFYRNGLTNTGSKIGIHLHGLDEFIKLKSIFPHAEPDIMNSGQQRVSHPWWFGTIAINFFKYQIFT